MPSQPDRAGRLPQEITLVAVTKKQPAAAVAEALAAGALDLGENYVQEGAEKRIARPGSRRRAGICWAICKATKPKGRSALFDLIQSVDSVKLAKTLGGRPEPLDKTQTVLLQVHLG